MNETITRAERSIRRELTHAEEHVSKLRKALAAMQAINGKGTGQRTRSKGKLKPCECGTMFRAFRSDARFCSSCREKNKLEWGTARRKKAKLEAKRKGRGTTLVKNTPTAARTPKK